MPSIETGKEEFPTWKDSAGEEREPQTQVEEVVLISFDPEATGRAARHAKLQRAQRPPPLVQSLLLACPRRQTWRASAAMARRGPRNPATLVISLGLHSTSQALLSLFSSNHPYSTETS